MSIVGFRRRIGTVPGTDPEQPPSAGLPVSGGVWLSTTDGTFLFGDATTTPGNGKEITEARDVETDDVLFEDISEVPPTWDSTAFDVPVLRSDGTQYLTRATALGAPGLLIAAVAFDSGTTGTRAISGARSTETPGGPNPNQDAWALLRSSVGTTRAMTATSSALVEANASNILDEKILVAAEMRDSAIQVWMCGETGEAPITGTRIPADGQQVLLGMYLADVVSGIMEGGVSQYVQYPHHLTPTRSERRDLLELIQGKWWPGVDPPQAAPIDAGEIEQGTGTSVDVVAVSTGTSLILASIDEQPEVGSFSISGDDVTISIPAGAAPGLYSGWYCIRSDVVDARLVDFGRIDFEVIAATVDGYADTIEGIPNLLAYWPLNEPSGTALLDATAGNRDGTYVGTVELAAPGLPVNSDAAVDFAGTGYGTVAHSAGLTLSAFTLSVWFRLNDLPVADSGAFFGIVSKDLAGLNVGDFAVLVDDGGELLIQFQDASTQHRTPTIPIVSADTTYHLAVRANNTGFDAYLDGEYLGKNTSFTGALTSNTNAIEIGRSPTSGSVQADAVIDEVAIWSRVLTEAEVLELSQRTSAPVAANDSFVVPESATTVLDVTNNDAFVGLKTALTVQVIAQGEHGTATVRSDRDIDFAAAAVSADEPDSFTYRITDPNGTSNTATANVTVQNTASTGGGTLIYDFQPQLAWIFSGSLVPLASRDRDNVMGIISPSHFVAGNEPSPNRWRLSTANGGGVLVGAALTKGTWLKNSQQVCWNRAPDGSPALELYSITGQHTVTDFHMKLYNVLQGAGSRHMRVVMEIRLCAASDPTTFKAHGLGPTTGSYPNFRTSHSGTVNSGIKFFTQLWAGERAEGVILCNWWNNSSLPIHRVGLMCNTGPTSKRYSALMADFGRTNSGGTTANNAAGSILDMEGCWTRIELEVRLTTPSLVPTDARRANPVINPNPHNGDGFARIYVTNDLDGEKGTPGTRTLAGELTGLLFNPRFDDVGSNANMHTLCDLCGWWLNLHYGGQPVSQSQSWSWLRRVQCFRHD